MSENITENQAGERIISVNIEEEMKSSYIDYSMSVIVSRALPDVRDGLKPVHRRVLFGMSELGLLSNKPYKKSARIVGEVMGKYHPHGDSSIYDTLVRLAQSWSLRYPLVDGQGNFGSMDKDQPAAMRYTEARLRKIAEEMMADIDKNTVNFQFNFDDTLEEPAVMPSAFPNLIVNGSSGIAVGMATNMAPHNLGETIDGIIAYIHNNNITPDELMYHIKGPDFPTGAVIYGVQGIREAYLTGRGRVVIRARSEIEVQTSGREVIVFTEIPYQLNKEQLVEQIGDMVKDGKLDGISYVNDESDREGMRIVVKLKKDANSNVVLNNLYKNTPLQTSFSINNIALVDGRPRQLNLKELIHYYVKHRHEVIVRRTEYELKKAQERLHILEGLIIAQDNIDEVIQIIRSSASPDDAVQGLMQRFDLSEVQSRAIVDMRLRALTGLEREKLQAEHDQLVKDIAYYQEILSDEKLRMEIVKNELLEIKKKYGDERRTEIRFTAEEFNPEDFFADDDMVITISHMGYIKRTPLADFKTQSRGGVGSKGSSTRRDEDFLEHLFHASMHNTLLLFTAKGRCFWVKVYELPEGTKTSQGRAIQNIINIDGDDQVKAYINVKNLTDEEYVKNHYIVMCSQNGIVKKTSLEAYSRPRQNGINAITIREGDILLEARLTDGKCDIVLASLLGRAVRFPENKVRDMGRIASGVRGINLSNAPDTDNAKEETEKTVETVETVSGNRVIGMVCFDPDEVGKQILVVSENGFGKRSDISDYRTTNRGGKGVKTINITEKTGQLIAIKDAGDDEDLMIINKSGLTIRMHVSDIRIAGRATQGVKLINLRGNDSIASVTKVPRADEIPETTEEETPAEENKENAKEQ
ncbi:MAG: DNA gyrase subunit A [Bacteroidales bacterium]|jgi:DNA gyrase subunit A|nr:DNA gyrase subunit A [Bacteroidales bacterium]